jgi:hypothetical protein
MLRGKSQPEAPADALNENRGVAMKQTLKFTSLCMVVLGLYAGPAAALKLQFDYTDDGGFFSGGNIGRRTTLEGAGQFFETHLTDSLSAITSSGSNHFNIDFSNPSTGAAATVNDFSVAADTMVIHVGGSNLPGSTLGEGGPGGWSASGSSSFLTDAARRGQVGSTQGPGATDFAPWGGNISFDNATNWYFDNDTNTDESFSGFDFFSVALHEIGHVLGIGTSDSWKNHLTGTTFSDANFSATVTSDLAHWASNTMSFVDGKSQEAAMTPSIGPGTRKRFTDLDLAALSAIGWQVAPAAPVPVPAAAWLFVSALGFLGVTGRRSRT